MTCRGALLVALASAIALSGCGGGNDTVSGAPPNAPVKITLSSAFRDGGSLPVRYSCDGIGISPPLAWSAVPKGTKDLALLLEDPDAPGGTYVHWALFAINPKLRAIAPGTIPPNARIGRNSAGGSSYAPPCPPTGNRPHRYAFNLYALKDLLQLGNGAAPQIVRQGIRDDAIAKGTLTATFGH